MGLGAHQEGVHLARVLDELHQMPVRRGAGEPQSALGDPIAIGVVHLEAVPVPLRDRGGLICLRHNGSRLQDRRVGAQSHGPAEVGFTGDGLTLVGHRRNHRVGCVGFELGGVRLAQPHRARRLDHDALQTQAQPEYWEPTVACVPDGTDLAFDTADPESARNQHRVHIGQCGGRTTIGLTVVGGHPAHLHLGAVGEPARPQCLGHRQVGVGEIDVLAHQCDSHGLLRIVHPAQQIVPGGPIDVAERQIQPPHHIGVEFLAMQHLGNVIDRRCVGCGDHTVDIDIAHQRDLLFERLGNIAIAPQDQRIRCDADIAQGGDRMLGGFGLQLPRRRQIRNQRDVQEKAVLPAHLVAHLAGGLQERLGFDIADGAADLGDDHIGPVSISVRLGHLQDAGLDLISDMRDHLHGVAQILAAAFPGDHLRIHLPGGHVGRSGQIAIEEALVVADVEIGLGAVLGDEHLAVLERVHGARIDIEIRIELLHGDLQSAGGQKLTEAAGGQTLAKRGNDATGDENVLGGSLLVLPQCGQERPP